MIKPFAATLLLGSVLLTGCSTQDTARAASAAVVGDQIITMAEVEARTDDAATQIAEVLNSTPQRVKAMRVGDPGKSLSQVNLEWMIQRDLVAQAVSELGITPDAAAVEESARQVTAQADQILVPNGLPASIAGEYALVQAQIGLLGERLAAGGDANARGDAVKAEMTRLSTQLEVEANPRFGAWESQSLTLNPEPNTASTPGPAATPPPAK